MGHLEPLGLAAGLPQIFGHFAEMRGSRIFGVVDAVSESGNLLFLAQHLFDVLDRVGTGTIDGFQDVEDSLVGSAVQWAFQTSDGGDDGGVHIGESGGGDARGEG